MPDKIEAIRDIIRTDPLVQNYASMTDEEIAQHITSSALYRVRIPEVQMEQVTKLLATRGKLFNLIQQAGTGNPKAAPIGWVIQSSGWTTVNVDDPSIRAVLQMAADDPSVAADQGDLDAILVLADVAQAVTASDVARARRADDGTSLIEGHS